MKQMSKAATKPRVTDWIDGSMKPTLPGVYQKFVFSGVVYAHWNGEFWGMFTGPRDQPRDALKNANCRSMTQLARWRGLASDPSKGA